METIDDLVKAAISDLFPDHIVPDENNVGEDGILFKAPDHAILDSRILIERKSRNTANDSKLYRKLQNIAKGQGQPFSAFGTINLGHVIQSLPDPKKATQSMIGYQTQKMLEKVKDARKQFDSFIENTGLVGPLCVLIYSDNTEITSTTEPDEYALGKKMGGFDESKDVTGVIDAIIFIKHPKFVIDKGNNSWFKCLIKSRLEHSELKLVNRLCSDLHLRLSQHPTISPELQKIKMKRLTPVIV